jgi:hypothetical protein
MLVMQYAKLDGLLHPLRLFHMAYRSINFGGYGNFAIGLFPTPSSRSEHYRVVEDVLQ